MQINLGDYDWRQQLNNLYNHQSYSQPHIHQLYPLPLDQQQYYSPPYDNQFYEYLPYPDIPELHHTPEMPGFEGCAQQSSRNFPGSSNNNNNEFNIKLDVQQFKPEELLIKVVNGFLVVTGKHRERSVEDGLISRQLTGRYKIPDDVDQEKLIPRLSSDGLLTISAPKIVKDEPRSREIPIIQTNQPAVQQTSQSNKGQKEEEKKDDSQMES